VAKRSNIWDLVEDAAARLRRPRLKLWQSVAEALDDGKLPATLSAPPGTAPAFLLKDWLRGFRQSAERFNDPRVCARILKHIIVSISDFNKLLAGKGRRGPVPGQTGLFQKSDLKVLPNIRSRIKNRRARSVYEAALHLYDEGKIKGNSRESAAKRVATRYLREYPTEDS
jgi:hypothetical protein